jgi:hypothetical protein
VTPSLHDTAVEDHRAGPRDVEDDLPAKLGEIVDSYDRVLLARENITQFRLVAAGREPFEPVQGSFLCLHFGG